VAAGTLEEGAHFNRQNLVKDRAFHVARARQMDLARAHDTVDAAADRAFLGNNLAFEIGALANRHGTRADVAIDATIDLDVAGRG
jgi:hypothetical protein